MLFVRFFFSAPQFSRQQAIGNNNHNNIIFSKLFYPICACNCYTFIWSWVFFLYLPIRNAILIMRRNNNADNYEYIHAHMMWLTHFTKIKNSNRKFGFIFIFFRFWVDFPSNFRHSLVLSSARPFSSSLFLPFGR